MSKNRDQAAAVRFFKKAAIGNNEAPEKITLDGSGASHQAVAELKAEGVLPVQTLVRASKYLSNMIEQDHRKAPQRWRALDSGGAYLAERSQLCKLPG